MSNRPESEVMSVVTPTEGKDERKFNKRVLGSALALSVAGAALVGCSFAEENEVLKNPENGVYELAIAEVSVKGVEVSLDEASLENKQVFEELNQQFNADTIDTLSINMDIAVTTQILLEASDLTAEYENGILTLGVDALAFKSDPYSQSGTYITDIVKPFSALSEDVRRQVVPLASDKNTINEDEFAMLAIDSAVEMVNESCAQELLDGARDSIKDEIKRIFETQLQSENPIYPLPFDADNLTAGEVKTIMDSAEVKLPETIEKVIDQRTDEEKAKLALLDEILDVDLEDKVAPVCGIE